MRVALISLHTSPLASLGSQDAGGMNVYVHRIATELQALGHDVDVFTRRTSPRDPHVMTVAAGFKVVHVAGGPVRPVPKSVLPLHLPEFVAGMTAFAERHGVHYDVIHSHYWLSGLAGLAFRRDIDVPLVHMFHTLARVKEFYIGKPDPNDTLLRFEGERDVAEQADVIIGATREEGRHLERLYGVSPAHFRVIPPGVDVNTFRPQDKRAARRALGISGRRVVLFVGRADPIKRLDVLLHAIAAGPARAEQVRTLIIGGYGDDAHKRLVRRLGLDGLVEFRGIVPPEQMAQYYSAADICAVPSAYESFGLVAVEAMACATPVVAFNVGGLACTVRPGETGFLAKPGDRDDFAEQLWRALHSPDLGAMGCRGRINVQRFDWTAIAQQTVDVYVAAASAVSRERAAGAD